VIPGDVPQLHTPESVAQAKALFESLLGETEKLRVRALEARDKATKLECSAASVEHGVRVRVNSQGVLTGLDIDPRAYRKLGPAELAAKILELSEAARKDATKQMKDLLDESGLGFQTEYSDDFLKMLRTGDV